MTSTQILDVNFRRFAKTLGDFFRQLGALCSELYCYQLNKYDIIGNENKKKTTAQVNVALC